MKKWRWHNYRLLSLAADSPSLRDRALTLRAAIIKAGNGDKL